MDELFFETHTLIAALEQTYTPSSFLRDRYFPTNDSVDIFSTDDVLAEFEEGSKKLAPFVSPRSGGVAVERNGYTMSRYTPPLIAPKRPLTIDELRKKGFGEALFSKMTPEERENAYALKDAAELRDMISRREETMCSEIMIDNKCTMKQVDGLNGENKTPVDEIYYYEGTNNPARYTTTAPWDGTTTHMQDDLEAMARMLTKYGLGVADLLCSPDVADAFMRSKEIREVYDIRNYILGRVEPVQLSDSAAIVADINVLGRKINVISYDETYTADDGTEKLYMPSGFCVLTAPGAGRTLYGAVTQMEQSDGKFHTYPAKRVTKYYSDAKHNTRELTVSARPLPMPKHKNCFISAKVLSDT